LELLACTQEKKPKGLSVPDNALFRLAMNGVMPASRTKFLHFQSFRSFLFVFGR